MRRERARTLPHTNSRYQPRADTTCKMGEELTKVRSLLLHGQGILLINLWMCGRPGFDPWVGKIPWWRVWQPTPVFLSGESPWTEEPGGLQSMELQRVRPNWACMHTKQISDPTYEFLLCFWYTFSVLFQKSELLLHLLSIGQRTRAYNRRLTLGLTKEVT